MEISAIIGDIYDAGSNGGSWSAAGRRLFRSLNADAGTLRLTSSGGRSENVFATCDEGETTYSDYFFHIDPIRAAISRIGHNGYEASRVAITSDLVEDEYYHRTEFYREFAIPNGQNHMLLGAVGDADRTVVGFFRDSCEFTIYERSVLAKVLPHIRRAIQLSRRLQQAELNARLGYAAFEALHSSAIVVDADLNVLFANGVAERNLSKRGLPIAIVAGSHAGSPARLSIPNRDRAERIRMLVEDAAQGGSGGAMRLELEAGQREHAEYIGVFVSPQPPQFCNHDSTVVGLTPVLLMINELSRPSAPNPSLLQDLFGLSIAEGAVALALLGGQTAEAVARERDVSLETIRSQIRTVLRKTDATNLRDFERMGALLTMLSH